MHVIGFSGGVFSCFLSRECLSVAKTQERLVFVLQRFLSDNELIVVQFQYCIRLIWKLLPLLLDEHQNLVQVVTPRGNLFLVLGNSFEFALGFLVSIIFIR
jgi:hypothetical protein